MNDRCNISNPTAPGKLVSGFSAQRSIFRASVAPPTRRRSSAFCEVGLGGEDSIVDEKMRRDSIAMPQLPEDQQTGATESETYPVAAIVDRRSRTVSTSALISKSLLLLVCVAALLWPNLPHVTSSSKIPSIFARAEPVNRMASMATDESAALVARQDSTTVCKRWAQMSAVVNGTLYLYGGEATTDPSQTSNTWNNNFLTLDLTKTWQIGSPSLTSASRPSSMPAVALGTLWNDNNNLYLYGGEFSWKPVVSPVPNSLWQYSIASKTWTQHSNPTDASGQAVQRAAEGAGVSVPSLGRGFYLGGHLDGYTTTGWSQSIPRLYLQSTLEYTMPGFVNSAVQQASVGSDGAYRNLTVDSAGFPQRADGVLIYVPGYSTSGIIVALAGGTNTTFTQMNVVDVYDIAGSKWYRQATSGPTPKIRVNPCAVAVSAADGSSTQIYMYGGQNLQPALNQTQYDDMWILTLPSFTWIEVDQSQQSAPPARAGHTCSIWNGQMVVVGGYVDPDLSCDSPGVYVFNTSSLSWQTQYTALQVADPLNRQPSQQNDSSALQGSYGYMVPSIVQAKIGGNAVGSATVSAPAQYATGGPLVSGKPHTYTGTATATLIPGATSTPTSGQSNEGNGNGNNNSAKSNAGVIAAGVIAGALALLAAYLGFCAWVYRRQVKLYKNHLALMQRESLSNEQFRAFAGTGVLSGAGKQYSDKDRSSDVQQWSLESPGAASLGVNTSESGEGRGYVDSNRRQPLQSNNPYVSVPGGTGYATAHSSTDDLMRGQEPTFLGVMLNPRRSLRVVNKD